MIAKIVKNIEVFNEWIHLEGSKLQEILTFYTLKVRILEPTCPALLRIEATLPVLQKIPIISFYYSIEFGDLRWLVSLKICE